MTTTGAGAREAWKQHHKVTRCRWQPLDIFKPGDVLLCIREAGAPMLRKGHLYRVASDVPGCHAYHLEGIADVGFWGSRFVRPSAAYTRSGPIRRTNPQPDGETE